MHGKNSMSDHMQFEQQKNVHQFIRYGISNILK